MSNKGLNAEFKQGIFKMRNPQKYRGKNPPVFRSSYEYKFMKDCDDRENIIEWASESTVIPYFIPGDHKRHAYYIDFYLKLRTPDGKIIKYLVEIKPYSQTLPPQNKTGKRKKSSLLYESMTYLKNQAKWAAARKFAEDYGMKFIVLTEKELGIVRK